MKLYLEYMKIEKFLSQNPSFKMVVAANEVFQSISADLESHGVGMMESLILISMFFEKDKSARPTQIKESFGIPKANVSHCIRSLEKKKLIKRSIHEVDARGYILTVTAKGSHTATAAISYFDKLQNRIERKFDEKSLQSFMKTLTDISALHKSK
ncbi:MarR family winged helix-turn-helix transcriptional regulator [Bdellovibrio sp. HCB290]|uniref:MarR family winged helix-turn-helix transcriptional regulator n=1 Tax=Bdellovibrio sp. HCB290 TaxID=3394356 RepID=UPI0039B66F64